MGMFSKVCSKSFYPVIHHGYGDDWHRNYPELYEVVALYPDGNKLEGLYDGYGRVGGTPVCPGDDYDHELWESVKFVLKKFYEGESYEELARSHDELGQGHFMSERFIQYCVYEKPEGFKSYRSYSNAFRRYANW